LECAHVDRDALLADPKESTHAHDQPEDLAVLVEQKIIHAADLRVIRADHIGALELRENPLIGALRLDEFGAVHGSGVGFRLRR
jgi:hypothetical protein